MSTKILVGLMLFTGLVYASQIYESSIVNYNTNFITNGGFQSPYVGKYSKLFDYIPGWETREGEIGYGKIYNKNWP